MKIIDEVKIEIQSGSGGNGSNSFRREKYIEFGGPDGGNGGKGGDIIICTDSNLNTLGNFRYKKFFKADKGENGSGKNMTGKAGQDIILYVPIGTQVLDETGLILFDLSRDNQIEILLKGGKGGAGNACFKSSTNRSPRSAITGQEGEVLIVWLKLKILSDIGIVGLPNAGKSSLLSVISNARPKIADFPFTTLSPKLGMVQMKNHRELVFCDIPGLIEGASDGRGLGIKFLKHIERCKVLLHLIDVSTDVVDSFEIIANEIKQYSDSLSKKPTIIVFNKIDLISPEELEKKTLELANYLANSSYLTETNWFDYLFFDDDLGFNVDIPSNTSMNVTPPANVTSMNATSAATSASATSAATLTSAPFSENKFDVDANNVDANNNKNDIKQKFDGKIYKISTFNPKTSNILLDEVLKIFDQTNK